MMDAIGNTLQGATAIRGSGQQAVTQTAQPEADPLAGSVNEPSRYYSPVVRIDSETQRTVLQFRDGSDGKVLVQYPSEKQLEAYRSKATTERAKEQEKAEAMISGDREAAGRQPTRQATGQTGAGQRAGSPIAGQSTDTGNRWVSGRQLLPPSSRRRSPYRSRHREPEHWRPCPRVVCRRRGPAGSPVDLRLERLFFFSQAFKPVPGRLRARSLPMGCDPSAT